jgi:hypothetical protein
MIKEGRKMQDSVEDMHSHEPHDSVNMHGWHETRQDAYITKHNVADTHTRTASIFEQEGKQIEHSTHYATSIFYQSITL